MSKTKQLSANRGELDRPSPDISGPAQRIDRQGSDLEPLIRKSLEGVDCFIQGFHDNFRVLLSLPGNRLQEVYLESVQTMGDGRSLSVFSACIEGEPEYFELALRLNNRLPQGSLAIRTLDERPMLALTRLITHDHISASSIRAAVLDIAKGSISIERAVGNANDFDHEKFDKFISECINLILSPQHNESSGPLVDSPEFPPQLSTPKTPADEQSRHLDALLATVLESARYEDYAGQLEGLIQGVKLRVAAHLQPKLNAEARAMPHGTYEEKKTLAKWVNDELRRFDLAIKCPKTGQPSILATGPGNHPEIGRFSIEHKTADGKRARPVNSPELPHLELMQAAPRREALAEWHERVGQQRGGASRA